LLAFGFSRGIWEIAWRRNEAEDETVGFSALSLEAGFSYLIGEERLVRYQVETARLYAIDSYHECCAELRAMVTLFS